jgi:hypothetical protein
MRRPTVDEIKLFEELQPPPPPDATRMREAARARLTAATSAPLTHPARRRGAVAAVATTAALVAAGTGYGLTAAQGSSSSPRDTTATRGGSSSPQDTTAGLTAVHGCPGMYITAGTLERVSGTQLIIQPANEADHDNKTIRRAKPVTVATSPSTVITRPVSGTAGDITDGSHVTVQGTWSGETLAAAQVDIEATLPPPSSFGPKLPPDTPKAGHLRPGAIPPFVDGTVADAHDGSFTVVTQVPPGLRVQVITSNSTKTETKASASPSQLNLQANVVAVGQIGANGVLTASTVAESSSSPGTLIAGGPAKIRTSSCSAAAITTAALAGA